MREVLDLQKAGLNVLIETYWNVNDEIRNDNGT